MVSAASEESTAAITEASKQAWVLQHNVSFYARGKKRGQEVKCALSAGEMDTFIAAYLSESVISVQAEYTDLRCSSGYSRML